MDPSFAHDLIKGKIAETVFELMFRESNWFTVIPIGYEYTVPELAQYNHFVHVQKVLDNLRDAPDFALISQDKKSVYLVEVKYRTSIDNTEVIKTAFELKERWDPTYLFMATPEGFYFDPCNTIIICNGFKEQMKESWVNKETQTKYLELLKEFIK
jgi:hypothetical protein